MIDISVDFAGKKILEWILRQFGVWVEVAFLRFSQHKCPAMGCISFDFGGCNYFDRMGDISGYSEEK